jgi:hypothetical protein
LERGEIYEPSLLSVAHKYRGQNLAPLLYKFLIMKAGLILCSSTQQSPGGRKVWEKLAKIPGIFVYGYNPTNKNSFQIDSDDIENEYIYDIDYTDEIKYVQQELEHLKNEMQRDTPAPTSAEKDKFNKLSDQLDTLIKQQDIAQTIYLIAMKK